MSKGSAVEGYARCAFLKALAVVAVGRNIDFLNFIEHLLADSKLAAIKSFERYLIRATGFLGIYFPAKEDRLERRLRPRGAMSLNEATRQMWRHALASCKFINIRIRPATQGTRCVACTVS